jgi:hypothetical protein
VPAEIPTQFRSILGALARPALSPLCQILRRVLRIDNVVYLSLRSREEQLKEELRKLRLRPARFRSVGNHNDLGPHSPDTGVLSCTIAHPRSSFSVIASRTMAICLR